ncbi:LysE family translocator [Babesia caballi]|uniref:LysE family translocator n=1 Tax=Babesia caballi TaxID=5871 RepID=A0AAV4LQ45_BABCB|nr:LysE family translocator [Babesia caballi]
MTARQRVSLLIVGLVVKTLEKRAQTRPYSLDVTTQRLLVTVQIDGRILANEVHVALLWQRVPLQVVLVVGGADQGVTTPWEREKHPAVGGLGNNHAELGGRITGRQNDMGATGVEHVLLAVIVANLPDLLGERTTAVHNHLGLDVELLASHLVVHSSAADLSFSVLQETDHLSVVNYGGADLPWHLTWSSLRRKDRDAQQNKCKRGQFANSSEAKVKLTSFVAAEETSQQLVDLNVEPEVWDLPQLVDGKNDGNGRIGERRSENQVCTLLQRLPDKLQLLQIEVQQRALQVSDSAVKQFGALGGSSGRKIIGFDQSAFQPTSGTVERDRAT